MIFIVCIVGLLFYAVCSIIFVRKFLLEERLCLKIKLFRHYNGTRKLSQKRLDKIFSRLSEVTYLLEIYDYPNFDKESFENEKEKR